MKQSDEYGISSSAKKKVLCGVCLYGWSQNVFMFQHLCYSKLLFWSAVEMELFICFNV